MAFDRTKVQFNEVDLSAAEALDQIYEALAAAGGFDFAVLASQVNNIQNLLGYILANDREDVADRLLALGMMFARDNVDLTRAVEGVEAD